MNHVHVDGRLVIKLPSEFDSIDGVITFPENPQQWVEIMEKSLVTESGIAAVIEPEGSGLGAITLTFCPCPVSQYVDRPEDNNFSMTLSNQHAFALGKALTAMAQLNKPV